MATRRVAILVEYEGTAYCGYQHQRRTDRPTIQAALEAAYASLTGDQVRMRGAGRTDAGVHASGQVVDFEAAGPIPTERIPAAMNTRLPRDIVVKGVQEVPQAFDACRRAIAKTYIYSIHNARYPSAMWRRFRHFVPTTLDVQAMREAASRLQGRHDFAAFQSAGSPTDTTVRTLEHLCVERRGELLQVRARADGFLYHMVRSLVGTLLEVGEGRRTPEAAAALLESKRREDAGPTAPACGLCLEDVEYESLRFDGAQAHVRGRR